MANPLLQALRANDKTGLFETTQTSVSYKTGFIPFDYRNGYMVEVCENDGTVVASYPSIGLVGGTFTTVIGKTGVAKSTFVTQICATIVKAFDGGLVLHYDLEKAATYTRVKNITNLTQLELLEKYIIKQEKCYIEDIFDAMRGIRDTKAANPKEFTYDTGLLNEFNQKIIAYVPTFIIIDSIPSIASREVTKDEIEGSTYGGRIAKVISQFYKRAIPFMKEFNINVVAVNHINAKIEINPMMKSQPQTMYLKVDESVPGGNAPLYYANQLLKFVTCGKLKEEDDGIDGFKVRCELIKSRTNRAGQSCTLVYEQNTGFDPARTLYEFAHENGLVDGRNPHKYIKGYPDAKFNQKKFTTEFTEKKEVANALIKATEPVLRNQLSHISEAEKLTKSDVLERLLLAQEDDVFEEETVE